MKLIASVVMALMLLAALYPMIGSMVQKNYDTDLARAMVETPHRVDWSLVDAN